MAKDQNDSQEESGEISGLSIYGYPQCPFCRKVLDVVRALGLDISLRNVFEDPDFNRELEEATGRRTVPVLRIDDEAGNTTWMPESADIVRYLNDRFGR